MKEKIKVFLFIIGLLFVVPFAANAEELPGARSATNEAGDVFLGGNYIEIGISKGGSFGTSAAAPESFKSHATSATNYRLGLLSDGDGWDVGNVPTTGDFFLPGTPEERFILSYKIDGNTYDHNQADRVGKYWNSPIQTLEAKDESDISNGLLKAVITGITKENVKVEITYSFGVNDKYYLTDVKITNLGDKDITDVRFTRSFDPDQDADKYSQYNTYNKVICNPDSTQEGSNTNYAMVVARGSVTHDGYFFVSFDNRARASRGVSFSPNSAYLDGLWIEKTEGLPTSSTEDDLKMSSENINGYTLEDNAIALTFNIGTLKKDKNSTMQYYSSLDPNVLDSITDILKAVSAEIKTYTDNKIEIQTKEGYEYSIDGGETWQETGIFDNLEPGKEYTILSRIRATETNEASEPEETTVTTKNSSPKTPDIKAVSVTEDSITVQKVENYEYSIDGGKTWQNESTFIDLKPNTEYEIIARYAETSDTMYGTLTQTIKIKTDVKEQTILDNLSNVDVSIDLDNDLPIITINKGILYESVKNDEDIKQAVENNNDVNIEFVVQNLDIDDETFEMIEKNLNNEEKIAFNIDATIKLYVNNNYVKDIVNPSENITFKIDIPNEYIKENRKFYIIRTHTDESGRIEVERLEDADSNDSTITIVSNKFSSFTITYTDNIESIPNLSETTNPQTGDNIMFYFSMLGLSIIGLAGTGLYTKKKLFNK